jgi:hypothetical protein
MKAVAFRRFGLHDGLATLRHKRGRAAQHTGTGNV